MTVWTAIIEFLQKIGLIFDPGTEPAFINSGEKFFVSFEGLGIGQFQVNPVAIPVLNGIRWYGIFITLAIILAFLYVAKWRAKECGYHFDDILDFVLIVVPVGVLGARLFYVFSYGGYDWSNWFRIWDGGLAIYGGVIAGALAIIGVGLYKKVRILRLLDCTAPAVMIAQAIGRWGNFTNGEAFGAEANGFFLRMGLAFEKGAEQVYVHPTFLYESLWNVLGFVLINLFYKKKKFDGQIMLEYFAWYGLGRFFIELLRQDSLPLRIGEYDLRISSVIGMLCFLACTVLLIVFISKGRNRALDLPCYYPGAKRLRLMEAEKAEKAEAAAKVAAAVEAAKEAEKAKAEEAEAKETEEKEAEAANAEASEETETPPEQTCAAAPAGSTEKSEETGEESGEKAPEGGENEEGPSENVEEDLPK